MSKIHIPHDAIVFIGDGSKALFLRNAGDEKYPNLKTEQVFVDHDPPTHDQGTDKPGRSYARVGPKSGTRSGTIEQTDWHELEKHHFAAKVGEALEKLVRERNVKAIVIAAPPRALADLRRIFHNDVKSRIIGEINKDFTKHPVDEIEKHLLAD